MYTSFTAIRDCFIAVPTEQSLAVGLLPDPTSKMLNLGKRLVVILNTPSLIEWHTEILFSTAQDLSAPGAP
jgi:hypothetical protein